jgi:hypothetical protein
MVCAVLGHESAAIERWQVHPLSASSGAATAGIYRVSGAATDHGTRLDWALILKIIRPAAAWNPATREIDHPIYWQREALAYQSGMLDDLPGGIAAPRCLAIEERADESCWLWLEEVGDAYGSRWPFTQYVYAARAGPFQWRLSRWAATASLSLAREPGALRDLLQAFAFVRNVVENPTTWQHPLLRAAFPVPVADRLLRLWDDREPLLAALDRLPRTLCHKDAFRRNMFAPSDAHGQQPLVLIDWAYVGHGEIGLDIADLFGASYITFGVEPTDLETFDATIFDSYMAGLREAGWQGDRQLARFGFVASAALKYACLLFWLADLADEQRRAAREAGSGQPIDAFVQHQAGLVTYLLDRADEAHDLLRVI